MLGVVLQEPLGAEMFREPLTVRSSDAMQAMSTCHKRSFDRAQAVRPVRSCTGQTRSQQGQVVESLGGVLESKQGF